MCGGGTELWSRVHVSGTFVRRILELIDTQLRGVDSSANYEGRRGAVQHCHARAFFAWAHGSHCSASVLAVSVRWTRGYARYLPQYFGHPAPERHLLITPCRVHLLWTAPLWFRRCAVPGCYCSLPADALHALQLLWACKPVDLIWPSPWCVHGVRSHVLQRCCAQGFQRRVGEDQEEADCRRLQAGVETQRHSACLSANRDGRLGAVEHCPYVRIPSLNSRISPSWRTNAHLNRWLVSTRSCARWRHLRVDGALHVDVAESLTIGCSTRAFSSCIVISAEKSYQ